MFADYVAEVADLLALQRRIVGVRFIPFELEYAKTDYAAELRKKRQKATKTEIGRAHV